MFSKIVVGDLETNAYFYFDHSRHAFLIDPGAQPDLLLNFIAENNLVVDKILLTHGHFDHIGAAAAIQNAFHIPILMHSNGFSYVHNPQWNLSAYFGINFTLDQVTFIPDFTCLSLQNSDLALQIIHTPGHTSDSSIFYSSADNLAFVGDSIFRNSCGRTDLPGGDKLLLHRSLSTILSLPPQTTLLPGHGPDTSVALERLNFSLD